MNSELLAAARATTTLIATRIQLTIPAVLAEGETFALRLSVTGGDALPVSTLGLRLRFEGSAGVEGLPASYSLPTGQSTGCIEGLKAIGPRVALIRALVEGSAKPAAVFSNPAWIFRQPPYRVYFGDLHVHTALSNCSGWRCLSPEWCYTYAREVSLLDFVAPADHLRGIASEPPRWPELQTAARRHNAPGRFVSMLAFESSHAQGFGGDNNVYYLNDDAPYFWCDREDMQGISPRVHLRDLWRQLDQNGKPYFTVPHHTGRAGKYRTWAEDYHDPVREPLFEIYSSWGSSEMRHTRMPISGGNNDAPAYFVDALKAGARFGVIASSDDHATLPGSVHHFRVDPFCNPTLNGHAHKGLAAVCAPELTREALFRAMQSRHTYATTHARSLVEIQVGDSRMGHAIPVDKHLAGRRDIRVRVTPHGSSSVRVTLMRNGEPLDSRPVRGPDVMTSVNEVSFQDTDDFESVMQRDTRYPSAPFVVYYARVEDSNGAHQWTSPIWVERP